MSEADVLPDDRDVRFGSGAIRHAGEVVSALGGQRVLLVCGRRSFDDSGAASLLEGLESVAEVRRWSDFRPNTEAPDLLHGLGIVAEFAPDTVLGVGGGSAMDMAKLLCAFRGITGEEDLHRRIRSGDRVGSRETSLVLAPTTAGSGSEATHFAVVYIDQDKFSIAGPRMLPDTVLLDPALLLSGSRYQRATSGVDAVAQAIESLWSVGGDGRSRGFAETALGLLLPALPKLVNDPATAAAEQMALGAHLAGRAIDISKTTAAHALSYGITKSYGPSHGHAVALSLGGFIEAHAEAKDDELQPRLDAERHREAMHRVLTALGADNAADGHARFHALCTSLGLEMRLPALGITTPEQVSDLAARVNVERLGNNPVRFGTDALAEILSRSG